MSARAGLLALVAALLALVAAAGGCKQREHDPMRELVEHDTTGSAAAMAACSTNRTLPVDACQRVAARGADHVLRLEPPTRLDCEDAIELAQRLAPEKLRPLYDKCCHGEIGLQIASVCKSIAPPK
jgi:hypothetical protein